MKTFVAVLLMLVLPIGQAFAAAVPVNTPAAPTVANAASAKAAELRRVRARKRVCWRKTLLSKYGDPTGSAAISVCGTDVKQLCIAIAIPFERASRSFPQSPVRRLSGSDAGGLLRPPIS
ncbi:MAG: hypothetical protein Kow0026_10570 [Oricola sp.]